MEYVTAEHLLKTYVLMGILFKFVKKMIGCDQNYLYKNRPPRTPFESEKRKKASLFYPRKICITFRILITLLVFATDSKGARGDRFLYK